MATPFFVRRRLAWCLPLALVFGLGCDRSKPPAVIAAPKAPVAPQVFDTATVPEVKFVEITREAGITFRHANAARGEKLLPETMGSGAAFFDYDGDGDADLFLVNSTGWPDAPPSTSSSTTQPFTGTTAKATSTT